VCPCLGVSGFPGLWVRNYLTGCADGMRAEVSPRDAAGCRQQASPSPGQGCPVPSAPGDAARGCGRAVCDGGDVEVEEQGSCPWSGVWLLWACASALRPASGGHALPGVEVVVVLVCIPTSPWVPGETSCPRTRWEALVSGAGTLCFHAVPLQAALSCLSSACSCLLTDMCLGWQGLPPQTHGDTGSCCTSPQEGQLQRVLVMSCPGMPAPHVFHTSLSLADTSGGGTRRLA